MSRMAAKLAFIPQALSEGKNETRGDGSATNNYSSSTLCLCVPERERERCIPYTLCVVLKLCITSYIDIHIFSLFVFFPPKNWLKKCI